MKLLWIEKMQGVIEAKVPFVVHDLAGYYEVTISRRPHYCDRGDWMIYVDACGRAAAMSGFDGSDGFPRYFFGTEEEAKAQMETWADRRANVVKEPVMTL